MTVHQGLFQEEGPESVFTQHNTTPPPPPPRAPPPPPLLGFTGGQLAPALTPVIANFYALNLSSCYNLAHREVE